LFGTEGTRDKSFVTSPVSDWSNVHNYIKRHERLDSHSHNERSALHFVDVMEYLNQECFFNQEVDSFLLIPPISLKLIIKLFDF
jgi:hypothetical protein